jgi:hypothetical protein
MTCGWTRAWPTLGQVSMVCGPLVRRPRATAIHPGGSEESRPGRSRPKSGRPAWRPPSADSVTGPAQCLYISSSQLAADKGPVAWRTGLEFGDMPLPENWLGAGLETGATVAADNPFRRLGTGGRRAVSQGTEDIETER